MHPILTTIPTLAVSAIYCVWHLYYQVQARRRKKLAERVSYMLWVMANEADYAESA